ncbi:hypothetical protein C8J57DRAFT_1303986 [Mycena rebaudengoi]|nr:hypothetical protein C8J57DRAFT_1303986 [Mycena rebaudengoi]
MASRGTDNLRSYFRKATLPEMLRDLNAPNIPATGQKSQHANVEIRSWHWRQLDQIQPLDASWRTSLPELAISWADSRIPSESLGVEDVDSKTGERLTVPCPPTFDIPSHTGRRPTDIMRFVPWIDNLSLITVQRALHLLFPDQTSKWNFSLSGDIGSKDRKSFDYFIWSYSGPGTPTAFTPLGDIPRYPLVVAFQPPWILSEQDILEFSAAGALSMQAESSSPLLDGKERLWAKIWDTCVCRKTRWFALTSYNQWVFGAFSEGWTVGFVSEVYYFDSIGPTILELLSFWIACAMRLPGGAVLPKVRERLTAGPPHIPPEPRASSS